MSNAIIEKHINEIQGSIITGIPLVEAVSSHFEEVSDLDLRKAVLRELAGIYQEQAEELKKLYPWNPEFFTRDVEGFETYLKNYKPENGYKCQVFNTSPFDDGKLVFDRGRMNFVGARTSRGKTTAMVSMAADALTQGLPVLFASFEEIDRQIITRLVLNFAWRWIIANFPTGENNSRSRINFTSFNPGKLFQSLVRNGKAGYNPFDQNNDGHAEDDLNVLIEALKQGYIQTKNLLKEHRFMIFNGYLADLQNYLDALANIERGTVVFADYIQKIPIPNIGTSSSRYTGIKQLLRDLDAAVKKNDLISISGAQFGRTDNKTNSRVKDSFTDEAFQESSDIEQVGEIEIGIGRDPGIKEGSKSSKKSSTEELKPEPRMFFCVLKNRNGENNPALEYDLEDGRKFSYYATKNTEPHF